MQIINTENINITLIQEPYLYQEKIKGISRKYRTYAYGDRKRRAAIIANNKIDAHLITQYSDDTVLVEIQLGKETFYATSTYMDYNESININLRHIERMLTFTKGAKLILRGPFRN
jgi:hypothetical protein